MKRAFVAVWALAAFLLISNTGCMTASSEKVEPFPWLPGGLTSCGDGAKARLVVEAEFVFERIKIEAPCAAIEQWVLSESARQPSIAPLLLRSSLRFSLRQATLDSLQHGQLSGVVFSSLDRQWLEYGIRERMKIVQVAAHCLPHSRLARRIARRLRDYSPSSETESAWYLHGLRPEKRRGLRQLKLQDRDSGTTVYVICIFGLVDDQMLVSLNPEFQPHYIYYGEFGTPGSWGRGGADPVKTLPPEKFHYQNFKDRLFLFH